MLSQLMVSGQRRALLFEGSSEVMAASTSLKNFREFFVILFYSSLYPRILLLCSMLYDCFLSEQKEKN